MCVAGEVTRTQSLPPSLGPGFLVQAKFKKKKPTMGLDQKRPNFFFINRHNILNIKSYINLPLKRRNHKNIDILFFRVCVFLFLFLFICFDVFTLWNPLLGTPTMTCDCIPLGRGGGFMGGIGVGYLFSLLGFNTPWRTIRIPGVLNPNNEKRYPTPIPHMYVFIPIYSLKYSLR